MIYLKTYKGGECDKCKGGDLRDAYATFRLGRGYDLVEKYYNGELKLEEVFDLVSYCHSFIVGDTYCYLTNDNFYFDEELSKDLFSILVKILESKPSKEAFEDLYGDSFFCSATDSDELVEVEYVIKGKRTNLQNLEVLLQWINSVSSDGRGRSITLSVDGDILDQPKVYRKDGKSLSTKTTRYGVQIKDREGEVKKLSF